MQTALKMTATVLPGRRIELTAPELPENGTVEVIVVLPEADALDGKVHSPGSVLDFLDNLPIRKRTPEEWAEYERQLQEERNAWDR